MAPQKIGDYHITSYHVIILIIMYAMIIHVGSMVWICSRQNNIPIYGARILLVPKSETMY